VRVWEEKKKIGKNPDQATYGKKIQLVDKCQSGMLNKVKKCLIR